MDENFASNNSKNDNNKINSEEIDYKNLINVLKEISANIDLLEKKYISNL